MFNIPLGFTIRKPNLNNTSFVSKTNDDGALERISSGAGFYGYNFNFDFNPKNDVELINKYRSISILPELDSAIDDIVNEAIVVEQFDEDIVRLNINVDEDLIPEQVKELIVEEFQNVLSLMDFAHKGHDIFRQWYIDGRLYYHIVVDERNVMTGIKEIRFIDPRKIKKVREITKTPTGNGIQVITGEEEYFVYNDSGIMEASSAGVKLSVDTIVYTPSGLQDQNDNVISYLHKAIKPLNMLRMIEDAMLVYNMTRAVERRAFYIDVSGMNRTKGEQYLQDVMKRHQNKIVYNSSTGEFKDDRHFMSMMEDYWLPRTSNGRATEITTLPATQIVGQLDALNAYKDKLARSLNLPVSRVMGDTPFNLGRSMEITRDEVKFSKFISKIRSKFCETFTQLLRVQLILKGIISPEDWQFVKSKLQYDFIQDNNFAELRDNEILAGRLEMYQNIQPLIGKEFSQEYVRRKILRMTDEQIEEEDKRIEIEREQQIEMMKKYPELYQGGDQQ